MGKNWVLIAAIIGSSMSFIDGTAVTVALPIMQRELQATSAQMQWVIEAYALFLSALIIVGGSLGDIYGRRKLFSLGIVIFACASLACAVSPNVIVLIVARSVQGMGAALALPESLALISVAFTGEERGRAIGTWSGFASITGAAGPLIGGYLAQTASWRWVFVINVPLAIVVLAICALRVEESRDENAVHGIDTTGAALATLGLGALVYGLIRSQTPDGRIDGTLWGIVGVLALISFVIAEQRVKHPMMPPHMFTASRVFTVANIYTFSLYLAMGGSLYFFPYVLIDVQGYAPAAAGAAFLPFVILQFSLSRWSGGLVAKIGARLPLIIGAVVAGIAFIAYAIPGIGGSYWTTYFPAVVLLGAGGTFFIAPLTTTVFDSSDPAQSGMASAINNAIARTAGLLAIALFGIIFAGVFNGGFDARLGRANVSAQTHQIAQTERAKFIAGTVPDDVPKADRAAVDRALKDGYISGYRAVMLTSTAVCWLAALIAIFGLPKKAVTGPAVSS